MLTCTFEEIEWEAMRLAERLGISSKDVTDLDLVAKIVHNAHSPSKSYISLSVEDCRCVTEWLRRSRQWH